MSFSRVVSALFVVGSLVVLVPGADAQQGRMRGQVISAETGDPIVGALIVAELPGGRQAGTETTTDDDGRFQVIGLDSGEWQATISAPGFMPAATTIRVSQGSATAATVELDRELSVLERALGVEALEGLDPVQLEADLTAADATYNSQDFEGAIAGYRALLEVLPQMTNLHLQIGNALRAMGRNEEALESYQALQEADPSNSQVETEIARTRLAMGDLEGAASLAANVSLSSSREDLYNLGELEFAKGDVAAAAGWYEKASAADRTWELPLFKLGLVALNQGDMETAKQHFQEVVELAPDSESGVTAAATLSALP